MDNHGDDPRTRAVFVESFGVTDHSIWNVYHEYKTTGRIDAKPNKGRPSKLNYKEKLGVCNMALSKHKYTLSQLMVKVKEKYGKWISAPALSKLLKKRHLKARVAVRRPKLSEKNRKARSVWAREHLKHGMMYY